MFAIFNLGAPELIILLVMGVLCVGVPVAAVVLVVVLSQKRPREQPPDSAEDDPR